MNKNLMEEFEQFAQAELEREDHAKRGQVSKRYAKEIPEEIDNDNFDPTEYGLSKPVTGLFLFVGRNKENPHQCWYRLKTGQVGEPIPCFLDESVFTGKLKKIEITEQAFKKDISKKLNFYLEDLKGKNIIVRSGLETLFSKCFLYRLKLCALSEPFELTLYPSTEEQAVVFCSIKQDGEAVRINWEECQAYDLEDLVMEINSELESLKGESK